MRKDSGSEGVESRSMGGKVTPPPKKWCGYSGGVDPMDLTAVDRNLLAILWLVWGGEFGCRTKMVELSWGCVI